MLISLVAARVVTQLLALTSDMAVCALVFLLQLHAASGVIGSAESAASVAKVHVSHAQTQER